MRRFLSLLFIIGILVAPASAVAFDPFGGGACSAQRAGQSVACSTGNSDPIAGSNGLFMKITNIIAYLGGAIAIVMIIIGALRYITSGSDISTGARTDTDTEEARRTIYSALVGLVIIILAKTIIQYFVRRL